MGREYWSNDNDRGKLKYSKLIPVSVPLFPPIFHMELPAKNPDLCGETPVTA
jgi:hypothetical protein